jgi:hypothetical protein
MIDNRLILGDIDVNTINGRILPKNAEFVLNITNFYETSKINIPFNDLKINRTNRISLFI